MTPKEHAKFRAALQAQIDRVMSAYQPTDTTSEKILRYGISQILRDRTCTERDAKMRIILLREIADELLAD